MTQPWWCFCVAKGVDLDAGYSKGREYGRGEPATQISCNAGRATPQKPARAENPGRRRGDFVQHDLYGSFVRTGGQWRDDFREDVDPARGGKGQRKMLAPAPEAPLS